MTPANAVTSESTELASVITPTFGRPESLPLLWLCIRSQTWANIEWLVDDDSPEPSRFMLEMADDKVRYFHNPARRSIGRKRNGLVAASRGSYIVHFDDDDYYSPHYISRMISSMTGAGAQNMQTVGLIPVAVTEENNAQLLHMHLGFASSYVYTRALWGRIKFKDINLHEDATFMLGGVENQRSTSLA